MIETSQTMTTYSTVKHKEIYIYITPTNSTPKHHSQRIGAISVCSFNLHTTVKLPPVDKEYMCFHIDVKST